MAIEDYRRFITTIDGGQLSGAYADLPVAQRLVELAEADQEDTEEIVSALVGYACHQGLLESSARAIAGALVRLADAPRGAWALRGLQELGAGATGLESTLGFLPPRSPLPGCAPRVDQMHRFTLVSTEDHVEVSVEDTGRGIAKDELPHEIYSPELRGAELCLWLVRGRRSLSELCLDARTGEIRSAKVVL